MTTDFRLSFEDFVLPELTLESLTSRETRSQDHGNTDMRSSLLNAQEDENSSTEYFTPVSELPYHYHQDEDSSENSEEEDELQENKEEQAEKRKGSGFFLRQLSSTFSIVPSPRTPKTPREELLALRTSRGNMYTQLLRTWKSREEVTSPGGSRSRSLTSSGAFSRSVLGSPSQVAPVTMSSQQLIGLCEKEDDVKEHTFEENELSLETNPEQQQQMKKVLTRHSVDSGVYSADGISLSDLN